MQWYKQNYDIMYNTLAEVENIKTFKTPRNVSPRLSKHLQQPIRGLPDHFQQPIRGVLTRGHRDRREALSQLK